MENFLSGDEGFSVFSFLEIKDILNMSLMIKLIHEKVQNHWSYFIERDFQIEQKENHFS